MKKVFITPVIVSLFVLTGPLFVTLQAQNLPKTCRVNCPDGSSHLVECNTTIDPCTGGTLDPGRIKEGKRLTSPVANGIYGAMLGGLAGSLLINASGENQWATGAAFGYGFFAPLTLLINKPQKRSVAANLLIGVTTGASVGYAEAQMEKYNKKPTTPAQPDKTLERTLEGISLGIAVTAVSGGFHKEKKGGYSSKIWKSKFLSNMAFTMSGNRIGVIVRL